MTSDDEAAFSDCLSPSPDDANTARAYTRAHAGPPSPDAAGTVKGTKGSSKKTRRNLRATAEISPTPPDSQRGGAPTNTTHTDSAAECVAGVSGSASSSSRSAGQPSSQPAGQPDSQPVSLPGKKAPRVPPSHLPPDLPATASEVFDASSLARVVTLLATLIGKAIYDGKSVTASNKRLIALAAEETRKAVSTFERLAPSSPPAPSTATTAVAATADPVTAPSTSTAAALDTGTERLRRELTSCIKEVRLLRGDLSAVSSATASPPSSYAQIAGRPPAALGALRIHPTAASQTGIAPPAPSQRSRPAIIVATKEPVQSRQEAVSTWRDAISFKNTTYAPARVQPLSNSKLRVEFETTNQRDETLSRLRDSGKVTVEPARRTRPMFILRGISKDVKSEELIQVLKQQNPGVGDPGCDGDIVLRFLRNNKNPNLYNAVLTADPGAWRRVLEIERVNIDHQKVRVHEFTPFVQCHACFQFGHTRKYCGREAPAPCAYCTSTAHNETSCPEKERKASPKCINCVNRNDKFNTKGDVAHPANSPSCPILCAMRRRVESNIDYGL